MKFKTIEEEKYTVVVSEVEKLDSQSAPDLKSELVYQIKSGKKNLIVDLEKSRYCDSSGLSALLTGNRGMKENDGTFVICCLQPSVDKLVQISQLKSVLNITPTRDEAVDMVMMEEVERDLGKEE